MLFSDFTQLDWQKGFYNIQLLVHVNVINRGKGVGL